LTSLDFYCVVVENKTIPKRSFYWYPPWPPLARIFKKSVTRALLPQFTECDLDQQLRIGSKSLQNKHQSSSERFHLCNCRVDRHLFGCVYALAEANWYHWFGSGQNGLNGIEGLDVINFGSTNVAGNDIVTGAVGVKLKPSGGMEIGVAWEAPLTDRRDIIDNRLTVDWILRY
jgi:hypothetical protein